MFKKVIKIFGNLLMVIIIIIIAMSLFSTFQYRKNPDKVPTVFGYCAMSVLSGSMRPYMEPGDMIVDRIVKADEINVGDVVTYKIGSSIVTHRVTEVITEDGKSLFITRGDANNTEDGKPITEDQLLGKVIFRIPYGGYIARFIRSPVGLLFIIVIPVSFMLFGELRNILSGGNKKDKEKTDPKAV